MNNETLLYAANEKKHGPLTLDELKEKRISKTTLVWTEGLEDWTEAQNIDELKSIISPEPPPLPKKKKYTATGTLKKVDDKKLAPGKKETNFSLAIAGFIILIIWGLLLHYVNIERYNPDGEVTSTYISIVLFRLGIRIPLALIVSGVAFKLNRSQTFWGLFTFFFPPIAMIVMGFLNKKELHLKGNNNMIPIDQSNLLFYRAKKYIKKKMYLEAFQVLDKAIELDHTNENAIKQRATLLYNLNELDLAQKDFSKLISIGKFLGMAYYYLGNIAEIKKDKEAALSYWKSASEISGRYDKSAKAKLERYKK